MRRNGILGLTLAVLLGIGVPSACGSSAPVYRQVPGTAGAIPAPSAASSAATPALRDWTLFGLTPQRPGTTDLSTGIDAANLGSLHRLRVTVPGTVDSAAVYLHGATVDGAAHDTAFMTTTYGRTFALDVRSGHILWTFTPPGYSGWAGSSQVTTATPAIDPGRAQLYASAPNGRIYKLSIADGRPVGAPWPVAVTYDPTHEKIASALNLDGPYLVVTTGGYYGDAPPYQGHVALIDRSSGRLVAVWNSLCANRRGLLRPATCKGSDSAIWARAGAVVEPSGRLLVATGNGPYDGRTDFGDSVIELTVPALRVRQVYTPRNQAQLNANDTDLGSSNVALLNGRLGAIAGKDGVVRLLSLGALDGRRPGGARRVGGELQRLPTPGGDQLFTAPAVWRRGGHVTMYAATNGGTGAYALIGGRLREVWRNSIPGTSPVLAGGLLYVFDPSGGGLRVYRPGSPRPLRSLPAGGGHWNSPIVVDGVVIEPEGNYMDHASSGVVDVYAP